MVAGSNCCDPLAFHFFRGRKEGLFEGRRRVDFLRDDPDDGLAMSRMMRGTTRPIIVDWNQDGHQDILMTYKGYRDFYILYGGPETAKSLLSLPMIDDHVASESYYSEKDRTELLFEAPDYKQLGAFTVSELDGDGTPEIVAAMGSVPRNSKQWLASEHRFFVLGREKRLARQAVD